MNYAEGEINSDKPRSCPSIFIKSRRGTAMTNSTCNSRDCGCSKLVLSGKFLQFQQSSLLKSPSSDVLTAEKVEGLLDLGGGKFLPPPSRLTATRRVMSRARWCGEVIDVILAGKNNFPLLPLQVKHGISGCRGFPYQRQLVVENSCLLFQISHEMFLKHALSNIRFVCLIAPSLFKDGRPSVRSLSST